MTTTTTPCSEMDIIVGHWLTLKEVAILLSLSERQVQRRVAKLPDADRCKSDKGQTLVNPNAIFPDFLRDQKPNDIVTDAPAEDDTALKEMSVTIARLEAENLELRQEKARLYSLLEQNQTDASEWRRLLVSAHPRLLSPAVSPDADPSKRPWWKFWHA